MVFTPPPRPSRASLQGRYCRLEPLAAAHAPALFAAYAKDDGRMWDYMPNGPFADLAAYREWLDGAVALEDPLQFAVLVGGVPLGTLSLLRIDPAAGSIEVGYIAFSPALQRTAAATEAIRRVFGIVSLSPVAVVPADLDAIIQEGVAIAHRAGLDLTRSFRVKARRADKTFPHISPEIERQVGEAIRAATGAPGRWPS